MSFRNAAVLVFTIFITSSFAQQNIEIKNNDFETISSTGLIDKWISSGKYSVDNQVYQSGSHSLKIIHQDWNSTAVLSEPVELIIGHLYKLSAWIKTEGAESNPYERYPTPVAVCLSMESFPFTNHSASKGATSNWTKVEVEFLATAKNDCVKLVFGNNGKARGKVWFDNVELQKVEDITSFIPYETVKWFNDGYRYDDKGWIFVHVEGEPYDRGYQYGYLVSEEIAEYINKLGIQLNKDNPEKGWGDLRFTADAMMLRKYDDEYLKEMKGIADGVNKAGSKIFKRKLDLVDIVAVNSAIDIDYSKDAMRTTSNSLSGQSFLKAEDELNIDSRLHKCSSFLANNSSTPDGRILFGQMFMWGGYTGSHWNIMIDVQPSEGHRLVYETFPGGIHSGTDFYINDAGIMIGETTVGQTPFNVDGTPQSNRIRKAAQYAENIDDVVKILTTGNNGMYTNDWLIGDVKANEIAVLLLGTYKYKLWRSSKKDFIGETKDFYWCNNNNRDPEVRKEYRGNIDNAPYDLIFTPWNRDVEFNRFYNEYKNGKMDVTAGVNLMASSPTNRPHACDGKITTSDMAEHLVFLAHYGKVTLREKFVNENGRIPDLPGAFPHLTLGYSVVSPVFVTQKLKEEKLKREKIAALTGKTDVQVNKSEVSAIYPFDERKLWINTVYPSSEAENWFVSGTAAYWSILKNTPASKEDVLNYFREQLAELNLRYLYTVEREGSIAPSEVKRVYTKYNNYQVPRIKGTYLLHQLRLLLGNGTFSKILNEIHDTYRDKEMTTKNFIDIANRVSGKDITGFINQWIERDDLPEISIRSENSSGKMNLKITQKNNPYHFFVTVKINGSAEQIYKIIEVKEKESSFVFDIKDPVNAEFNVLFDIPLKYDSYYTWANIFDDWKTAKIVYGTSRQIEANHTLALRFSTALADRFTEDLIPVIKDSELKEEDLRNSDLILIGSPEDNQVLKRFAGELKLDFGKNVFKWNGKTYGRSDDGLYVNMPNPYNPLKAIYIFNSNSALELYQMTKVVNRMPQWALYKGDKITEKGYFNK